MKAAALVLGLAGLAGLAALAPEARGEGLRELEAEQVALYDLVAPGVAVLSAGRALGAGFAVAPGLLLTAAHVVDGAAEVDVLLRDGRRLRGEVVERAAGGLDLALVRIPAAPPVLELAPSAGLRPGALVATVGHPDGNRFTLGTGLVAQSAADAADPSLLRLQLPLRQGASGAPVVDRSGRVVGVVALGAAGTVTFAIRTEAARGALRGLAGVRAEASAVRAETKTADAAPLSLTVSPRFAGGEGRHEESGVLGASGGSLPSETADAEGTAGRRGLPLVEAETFSEREPTANADAFDPPRAPEFVTAPLAPRPPARVHGSGRRPVPPRPALAAPVLIEEAARDPDEPAGPGAVGLAAPPPGPAHGPATPPGPLLAAAILGALLGSAGLAIALRMRSPAC